MEQLKFKKINYVQNDKNGNPVTVESNGVLPTKAHVDDAGYDLTATRITQELDESGKIVLVYHTDVAVEIPVGFVGLLCMRSSVSKRSLTLTNAVGIIDASFRGELQAKFKVTTDALPRIYNVGEKVAQLVIVPCYNLEPVFVDELSDTDRADGGFGSTDNERGTDLMLNIEQDEYNEGESGTGDRSISDQITEILQ